MNIISPSKQTTGRGLKTLNKTLPISNPAKAMKRWFYPNLTGPEAESILMKDGYEGSFLTRPSQNNPGDYALSVKRGDSVTHVRIQNHGDYYDLYSGEKFATLAELIQYYVENPGQLTEKNGAVIELVQPLHCEVVTTERWYHGEINGREAEEMLMLRGEDGSYMVRTSTRSPGNYVLSVRIEDEVCHLIIKHRDNLFIIGQGPPFGSLSELVQHHSLNPLLDDRDRVVQLKKPFTSTTFIPIHIKHRISELEKRSMYAYGKSGFYEEFEQLQRQEVNLLYSRKEGIKPENRPKNRFKNILPFDHSLVVIKNPITSEDMYINANYIDGEVPGSEWSFIATQGCLPTTIEDFWIMVWQEGTQVIVMLTNEVERGRNKCTRYWPSPHEPVIYGSIFVKVINETFNPHFTLRHFLVQYDSEERCIYQYHFKVWPEHGVPQDPGLLLGLMDEVNLKTKELKEAGLDPGPIVVHCSSGIGRSATYIAIDIIIKVIEYQGWEHEIDIQRSIHLLRKHRSGMVQTDHQYRLIYYSILHYVEAKQSCADTSLEGAGAIYGNMQQASSFQN